MFRFAMQHGGISPTGNTLLRENGSNRLAFGFQGVGLIGRALETTTPSFLKSLICTVVSCQ